MRRSFFSFVAFLFGVTVMGVSIWRITHQVPITLAVESSPAAEEVEAVVSAEAEKDEYALPYPGMLPDHPAYFLKMLRDRIQLWITRNPLKKARLMLHFADKRTASSLALAEKGKTGLAVTTATKAEQYAERALNEIDGADIGNEEAEQFYYDLRSALRKHGQVLSGVKSRLSEEIVESIVPVEELQQNNLRRVIEKVGRDGIESDEEAGVEVEMDEEIKAVTEPAELEE